MPKSSRAKPKQKAGLEHYRGLLNQHRQEILSMYQRDLRVGQEANDEGTEDIVDRANNAYSREFIFQFSGKERQLLIQIEQALGRVDGGTYGVCANCGEPIAPQRLEAVPWARYCVDCQEREERGLLAE